MDRIDGAENIGSRIQSVFAIFDTKVKAFLPPWVVPTNGAAVRSVADAVADKGSQFAKHHSDYVLFRIATWDDANGQLVPLVQHENLGILSNFLGE